MMTLTEKERERQNRNSQSNKCPHCGSWANSQGKCYTKSCVNYWKNNDKYRKGFCKQCFKSNVLINENGLCFQCQLTNTRLEIKAMIREFSLKEVQIEWENTVKPKLEELLRNAEYYQSLFYDLTEEEKREGKRRLKETIETIERDLYPERNKGKGGSGWVWVLIIVGVAVIGLVGFVWYRKAKKNH